MLDKPYQPVIESPVHKPTAAEKQFLHTYTAGAILPLTQASITAFLVFIGSFVVATFVFDAIDPLKPSVVFAVIAWIGTWMMRQKLWTTLASFEQWSGIDINNDGVIGSDEPQPKRDPIVIRIDDVSAGGHYQSNTHIFPDWLTDDQLATLANGLINLNRPFSRREWTVRSRLFSDGQYRELQSFLIKHGMIETSSDKSSNGGFVLTRAGRAAMEQLLPSPTEEFDTVME